MTGAIVVFTAKSVESILREGGSASWRLDRSHARQCPYAVCTRNAKAEWSEGSEPHHAAFLVGKVLDVVPCKPTPENKEAPENRYLVKFSEYARVNIEGVWLGDRNPVKYSTLEDLGIDPEKLKWEMMPEDPSAPTEGGYINDTHSRRISPLTMAEAKEGLALTFGVPPEAIEIVIRG